MLRRRLAGEAFWELAQGGRAEPRAADEAPGLPRLLAGTAGVHTASTLGYLPSLAFVPL